LGLAHSSASQGGEGEDDLFHGAIHYRHARGKA
jgi:hypothetical protein